MSPFRARRVRKVSADCPQVFPQRFPHPSTCCPQHCAVEITLAARQTRRHRDLDVLLPNEFLEPVMKRLLDAGFVVRTDWLPVRIELGHLKGDQYVDFHPIFADGDGGWWQYGLDDTRLEYPAASLSTGLIGTTEVRCLTAAKQRALHTGYELREQDLHDLAVLDTLNLGA